MNQQANKNKNPLLSCALTGGFEDLSTGIVLTTAGKCCKTYIYKQNTQKDIYD